MADVAYVPDGNQANNYLPWVLANNGGGLFGGMGGSAFWGALLGSVVPGIFGGWGNGFGYGGGGNGAAAALGAQATANNNADLILNAISASGEASRAAISNLATMLGQDYTQINSGISTIQSALNSLALSEAVSVPQIINSIQAGNTTLMGKLAECCCENRLLTTTQGYESRIATIEQTNQLGSQADRNANSIIGAINAQTIAMNDGFCAIKERELQSKVDAQAEIITQLRNQIDNANQTAAISSYVNGLVAPISTKLTEIESRMPATVPVQYPNLQVYSTTPNMNPLYGYGYGVAGGSYWG